jgi:hypothetical protein
MPFRKPSYRGIATHGADRGYRSGNHTNGKTHSQRDECSLYSGVAGAYHCDVEFIFH